MGTRSDVRWLVGGVVVAAVGLWAAAAQACMDYRVPPTGVLAEVVASDAAVAKAATAELRAQGPAGLERLMRAYARELRRHTDPRLASLAIVTSPKDLDPAHAAREATFQRLLVALDSVAAQKDAAFSGLYWYTDFEKAKQAAREAGKPILSLRLLGRLDEEYSCANSRYFRTVLYANAEVSTALRERFVLHWQSVRPVPKVTVDMGDGRVIQRTVTGNSVHYVLDADGRPVDAVPGLYGPKTFLRVLDEAERAVRALASVAGDQAKQSYLAEWHAAHRAETAGRLEADLREAGLSSAPAGDDAAWAKLASLPRHRVEARLDASSTALVRGKNPDAVEAGRLAVSKAVVEDPLARMLRNFQRTVALDTVRNEYELHQRVRGWFTQRLPETLAADVAPLNEKVYAELFLTPTSDPWLGLAPAHAYSALAGNGVN